MTHQNHQTNGASLEDCHTNFFALTELYGIKWRKLVWGESSGGESEECGSGGGAPLADPVISSYARCLAGDILCVWRRVPAPQPPDIYDTAAPPPPPLSLRAAKELWIFWYGEEPDLNGLVAPELIATASQTGEQGSWESGLSYECRSLLFKALHNLIERCLLSRDFVRLGKWFVQPYDGDEEDVGKSLWHLSFSFAFFLHGESTVCASVDVRQHPPVRTLTPKRLAKINSPDQQANAKVILAPFGLEGMLTGREWSETDAATARLLDSWRQLYPLEQGCGAVEVVCGSSRMRYPLPYALATEMEVARAAPPPPHRRAHVAVVSRAMPPALPALPALTASNQTPELCYGDVSNDKIEDYVDPTRKTPCTCPKLRRRRAPRAPPFHRRDVDGHARHSHYRTAPAQSGSCLTGSSGTGGGACSPGSCGGGSPPAAVSAPSSAGAPPHSPHHPDHTPIPHSQSAALVPTTLHTPAPTPDPLAPPTPAPPSAPPPKTYSQNDSPVACTLAKRPQLPPAERRLDPMEDEHSLHMLYDYTTVHAWLEHPVKRFKPERSVVLEENGAGAGRGGGAGAGAGAGGTAPDADLYAGHEHTRMAPHLRLNDLKQEQEDTKEYKNLFTSDGLCPTFKDLEQIFDNSDDAASGDETLALTSLERSGSESARIVRAEELSKMFPTPPSMEAHAQPSPGFTLTEESRIATPGSPAPDQPIEDWSYVFRPPAVAKYVGSGKYAPLTQLPSQLLPAVTLPPHAVYRPRARAPRPPPATSAPAPAVAAPTPPARTPAAPAPPRRAPAAAPPPPPAAPACPLLLNVLLADTVLNVFRDHNFDSCTLCVCNAGPKVVGNIRGADAGTYLAHVAATATPAARDEEPSRCTCGFSAVVNRRRAHKAGLFYEDEMEITGIATEPGGSEAGGGALGEVADALVAHVAAAPPGPAAALARAAAAHAAASAHDELALNQLEYSDGGSAAACALRAASLPGGRGRGARGAEAGAGGVHRWPYIGARAPRSSRDVVRLMRRLRPLLQDAIQKRCCGARMWDGVTGPLTWRQFHRLAGRGNEDLCEPQPVPPLLVGHERDWLALAPYALRHWERLALEPYSYPRDVAFACVTSHSPALLDPLRALLRELQQAYEACRLGRHRPLRRAARDGVVRAAPPPAGPAPARDDWAGALPPARAGAHIRAYADALRELVPALASLPPDLGLAEREATPDETGEVTDDEAGAPALVVYLVEPPTVPAHRAATLRALLRLATAVQHHLHHHNPLVKIISLESVCETWGVGVGASGLGECARALAFSVFTGARRLLAHAGGGRSLTGFGTAAAASQRKDERPPYRLYSPAWVLGAPRPRDPGEAWGAAGPGEGGVLFLAYCLSHDQRWLLAAASDARGELLDTAAINIAVPRRARRRRYAPARRLGLTKLMEFTLGVMSQAAQPWRLVVGRVGRIGHGELKGWSWLLSRKHLSLASGTLRDLCGVCAVLPPASVPCILSACLVSTEPEPALRLMADRFTPDERFSQHSLHSQLHTPRDVTATHILVFPTSATTQSNQMPFEPPMANGEDNDMMFLNVDMGDEDMGEGGDMTDIFSTDMFNTMFAQTSPGRRGEDEGAGSPLGGGMGAPTPHSVGGSAADSDQEQVGTVLQQPLALGYLVSTAPLGAMPAWWWAGCGHLRDACPAFLKSALLLHAGALQATDDFTSLCTRTAHNHHPLDSQLTTDVLRYVLEGYNALSWLALDPHTADRVSCLPLHVQLLMRLYHTAAALG